MGLMAPLGDEAQHPNLFGKIDFLSKKLICPLPVPPEYTQKFGLKPKTDVLDKNGQVVERDVFIGYKLEIDDIIVWDESYWDGYVERIKTTEYVVTSLALPTVEIGYFRLLQSVICNLLNVDGSPNQPQPRFDK